METESSDFTIHCGGEGDRKGENEKNFEWFSRYTRGRRVSFGRR